MFASTVPRVPKGSHWIVAAVLFTLLLLLVPTSVAGATSTPRAPATAGAARLAPTVTPTTPPALSIRPAVPPQNATFHFFQNNSTLANLPYAEQGCYVYNYTSQIQNDCYPQATSPSLVTLANGELGVGYTVYTNVSGTHTHACPPGPNGVFERVGFSVSPDNGSTFGPVQFLGNESCHWLDAIEPTFAVGSNGTVYGAYVEYNYTGNQGQFVGATNYLNPRQHDALGFTRSTNNGTSFSLPVSINTSGSIAHPQIAAFGQSLYILFENISNGTANVPYGYSYYYDRPIALYVLYSPNDGLSWQGPFRLPGTTGYGGIVQETGGSLAVNATGTVAVSYFTDESCVENDSGYCEHFGNDLVVTTSTTNGSTFSAPHLVSSGWGSTSWYFLPYYLSAGFQMLPQSAIAFSEDGETLYVGWTSGYNNTALFGRPWSYYSGYEDGGVFAATGPSSGTSWTNEIIFATSDEYSDSWSYAPAIGVSGGSVYLSYTTANASYCYPGSGCTFLGGSFYQSVQESSDGLSWSAASYPSIEKINYGIYSASGSFPGSSSSVGFTTNGTPVYGFALPEPYSLVTNYSTYPSYYNWTYPTALVVATPYFGPTLSINVTEHNASGPWSVVVDGTIVNAPLGASSFVIHGIAPGHAVLFAADSLTINSYEIQIPTLGVDGQSGFNGEATFSGNGTVEVNYTTEFAVNVAIEPSNPYYAYVYYDNYLTNTYLDWEVATYCPTGCGTPFPWFLPANSSVTLNTGGEPYLAGFWSGTGPGNYTGPGSSANLSLQGAVNETVWFTAIGDYNVSVAASGLPATSMYHFTLDGTSYSALAGQATLVPNVQTGGHLLSNIWANSSIAGWEYIGTASDTAPLLVPESVSVALTFGLIDLGVPAGAVSFRAAGFSTGTAWHITFNGTEYSSSTPWINLTTRPGTFPVSGAPAVSANGSVGYVPTGIAPLWNVTVGSTYVLNFTVADRLSTVAATGGTVTGGGASGSLWVAPGTTVALSASAKTGYSFGGWTGTGLGSFTGSAPSINVTVGGPVVESAGFFPLSTARFNLTVQETGLPGGTSWTVYLGSVGYTTTASTMVIGNLPACGSPGATFSLSVPYAYSPDGATRYLPTAGLPGHICTTGTTVEFETFASQFYVSVQSTPGGFGELSIPSFQTTSGFWVGAGQTVGLNSFSQAGYDFLGWNGTGIGSYSGPSSTQTIVVGGPVLEVAAFALPVPPPPIVYALTIQLAAPLAAGTAWTAAVDGVNYTTQGLSLIVAGLAPGAHSLAIAGAVSPDGLTKYTPSGAPPSVTLTHNTSQTVAFTASFWITVTATPGGRAAPASEWVRSGTSVQLNATASDGYAFVGWAGTGSGAYTGTVQVLSLRVIGPVTEVATFAENGTAVGATSASSLWSAPTTWVGLGIVGLIIGLVVGLIVSRRSRSPPPEAIPAWEGPAPEPGDDAPEAPP